MILFARQMEKPSSTWFGVFHRSYELSLGQRKKVLWIILPFWIALMYMTAILDSLSSASLSHHSYNAISREFTELNQVNQDSTQSGAQKEVTDQDIMASYLIAGAFSGNSLDREIHPKVLELKVSCSCGHTFTTSSTIGSGELKVETCSKCHPFYTGEQKLLKTSALDKFYSRQAKAESLKK